MPFGNVGQRHPPAAICDHLLPIDVQPCSTNLPTLELCPSHARSDALHDQRFFKFRDCADDHDDRPTERAFGIYRLALAEELNSKSVEFIQHLQEMFR